MGEPKFGLEMGLRQRAAGDGVCCGRRRKYLMVCRSLETSTIKLISRSPDQMVPSQRIGIVNSGGVAFSRSSKFIPAGPR